MTDFYDWSTTAADNASADSAINWAEGQDPDTVNNSARAMMKRIAEWRKDLAPTRATAGSSNAYTVTSQAGGSGAYRDGEIVSFIIDRANTAACTLNVNSRGAVPFRPAIGVEFSADELIANTPALAYYRQTSNEWLAINTGYPVNALAAGLLAQNVVARLIQIGTPVLSIDDSGPLPGYIRLTETTQTLDKADWPELNSWLSARSYPWGSAATTFNLPPAAGYFLRFAATSSSIDTSGARTAGSTQSDQNKAHTHSVSATGTTNTTGDHNHSEIRPISGGNDAAGGSGSGTPSTTTTGNAGNHSHTVTVTGTAASDGGDEGRVKNIAMHVDVFASSALAAGTLGMFGHAYAWDTGTSAADPGAGRVRGNNATLGSITALYISAEDAWGVDISDLIADLDVGAKLKISKIAAPAIQVHVTISGTITDNTAYLTVPVTVDLAVGALANSDTIAIETVGTQGAPGTTVPDIDGLSELPRTHLAATDKLIVYDGSAASHKALYPTFAEQVFDATDPEFGATNDSAAINAAIGAAYAAGGGTVVVPNTVTWDIDAPIVLKSFVDVRGSGLTGTVLEVSTASVLTQAAGSQLYGHGFRNFRFEAQSGFEDATVIDLHCIQHSKLDWLIFLGFDDPASVICKIVSDEVTSWDAQPEHGSNSIYNVFSNWYAHGCGTGVHLKGRYGDTPTESPANSANVPDIVITHNKWENINLWDIQTKGVDIEGAADTEQFENLFLKLGANNAIGIDIASDAVYTGNNYVSGLDFKGLIFSLMTGSETGVKLIQSGWSFGNTFQIKHDLNPASVTVFSDVASQSHYIESQPLLGSDNTKIEIIAKGVTWFGSDGTAALPSYSFRGDPNTGMYRAGSDLLGFAANGVGRLLVSEFGPIIPIGHNLIFQDADQSHSLLVGTSENLTGNRTLSIDVDDGSRALTIAGDAVIGPMAVLAEQSADPGDPAEGKTVIWQSDGTGAGDDGDIMIKITAGGVTKTATLIDFSAV